jgi:DNA-binding XRE family transcriptional regulator
MIMKQINKVTTQIEKIQPLRARAAMTNPTLTQAIDIDD